MFRSIKAQTFEQGQQGVDVDLRKQATFFL
jgi:hypothetical protein